MPVFLAYSLILKSLANNYYTKRSKAIRIPGFSEARVTSRKNGHCPRPFLEIEAWRTQTLPRRQTPLAVALGWQSR